MSINKKLIALSALSLFSLSALAADITVWKSKYCGCCEGWVKHMEQAGFELKVHNTEDMATIKQQNHIKPALASCHTSVVEGYVIEGHVPASDIRRLLEERPKVTGLTAPGMPASSPGMDIGNDPYDVLAFNEKGMTYIFSKHNQ